MEDDKFIVACTIFLCCVSVMLQSQRERRFKTRKINRNRGTIGFYKTYFLPMKENDAEEFFKYTRMTVCSFDSLLEMVTPHLLKKKKLRDHINCEQRLALTLHYFSQGSSMQTISWTYHMGHTTVHNIINEVSKVLWNILSEKFLKPPSCTEDWLNISKDFEELWNFPNCLGAIDGKHIEIQAPFKSGSQYFNYKKSFSIILLASCDANYNFTLVDIGAYGSESDGGVFVNSKFGEKFEDNNFYVPPPKALPNTNVIMPYTLVADEAFPLKSYIMRPYPGRQLDDGKRIFNYRLSRARRVIENTFGIMVNRWRLLRTMITAKVENIDWFVKAIVCLHNFVKSEAVKLNDSSYCPPGFVDTDQQLGAWREGMQELRSVGRISSNRASQLNYNNRDILKNYFLSLNGQIPWQGRVLTDGTRVEEKN